MSRDIQNHRVFKNSRHRALCDDADTKKVMRATGLDESGAEPMGEGSDDGNNEEGNVTLHERSGMFLL